MISDSQSEVESTSQEGPEEQRAVSPRFLVGLALNLGRATRGFTNGLAAIGHLAQQAAVATGDAVSGLAIQTSDPAPDEDAKQESRTPETGGGEPEEDHHEDVAEAAPETGGGEPEEDHHEDVAEAAPETDTVPEGAEGGDDERDGVEESSSDKDHDMKGEQQ